LRPGIPSAAKPFDAPTELPDKDRVSEPNPLPPLAEGATAAPSGNSDPWRVYRRVAWAVLILFLAGYGVRCVKHGWYEPPDPAKSADENRRRDFRGSDFTAYYSAGELVLRGESPYDWTRSSTPFRPFIYPAAFALFPMAVLALFPHNVALTLYYTLNVGALLVSLLLLRNMLWPRDREPASSVWRLPELGLLLALAACWRFFDSNFVLGNANVLILLLVVLGLYALQRERGGWAGLAIALATSYKVTPGLFGLYFLWTRRVWAMVGGAVGLLLFLIVLPGATIGWSRNWEGLKSFGAQATEKLDTPGNADEGEDDSDSEGTRAYGISLRGTLLKLLSPTVSLPHRKPEEGRSINVLDLDPVTTTRLADGLALVLLGLTVWLTWPRSASRPGVALVLSWGLTALVILLLSPHTRKAHGVLVLIPAAALVALLQRDLLRGGARKLAWIALLFLGAATWLTSSGVCGRRLSEVTHAAGASTWPMVLLFAACAWALWQEQGRTERGQETGPQ
jgi:hypothetical protein